jgi:hypothetical protein
VKTLADNFTDWEAHVFGFGYGTGEEHTVPAVWDFLLATPDSGSYDYSLLEEACGPTVAWLLINTFAHHNLIEYGTSPRHGWLTEQGRALQAFVAARTPDELIALTERDEDYVECSPDACNCGPNGYEKGRVCANPFWKPITERN